MLEKVSAPLWNVHAAQWASIRAPLRPSPEDVRLAQDVVDRWYAVCRRPPRGLVLGSTMELASLQWPDDSDVLAVDLSDAMLRCVWPARIRTTFRRSAVVGQWLEMPLQDASCDIVFGDASLAQLRKAEAPALARAVRRVMREEGVALLRVFTRPEAGESAEAVWSDLAARTVGNFHAFKLRLLMALAGPDGEVRPRDVWSHVHARVPSLDLLACEAGWSVDEVLTIDAYQDHHRTYWFPTLPELRTLLAADFVEMRCCRPSYELGDCCPTLLLAPRT